MFKPLLTAAFVILAPQFSAQAQTPPPPPKGDIAPPPLPPEGQKKTVPGNLPKKLKKAPGAEMPQKRPPVTPPTPEPTAPDQPN